MNRDMGKKCAKPTAVKKMADGGSVDDNVGFFERLRMGNIDERGSEAYNRFGAGKNEKGDSTGETRSRGAAVPEAAPAKASEEFPAEPSYTKSEEFPAEPSYTKSEEFPAEPASTSSSSPADPVALPKAAKPARKRMPVSAAPAKSFAGGMAQGIAAGTNAKADNEERNLARQNADKPKAAPSEPKSIYSDGRGGSNNFMSKGAGAVVDGVKSLFKSLSSSEAENLAKNNATRKEMGVTGMANGGMVGYANGGSVGCSHRDYGKKK